MLMNESGPGRWVTAYRVEVDHGLGFEPTDRGETSTEEAAYTHADQLRDAHPGSGVRVVEEARIVGDQIVTEVGEDAREV